MAERHDQEARPDDLGAGSPASQQVSWWPTHEFITALVANVNNLPVAGTPAWQVLSDDDPAKLLALAVAGEHHVLRVETAQEAFAESSRAIAEAEDWAAVARRVQTGRGTAYIERTAS